MLIDAVLMVVAFSTLGLSLNKRGYSGHLKWDSMIEALIEWRNIYESGVVGVGGQVLQRMRENWWPPIVLTEDHGL